MICCSLSVIAFDFELVEGKENPGDIPTGIDGNYPFSITSK